MANAFTDKDTSYRRINRIRLPNSCYLKEIEKVNNMLKEASAINNYNKTINYVPISIPKPNKASLLRLKNQIATKCTKQTTDEKNNDSGDVKKIEPIGNRNRRSSQTKSKKTGIGSENDKDVLQKRHKKPSINKFKTSSLAVNNSTPNEKNETPVIKKVTGTIEPKNKHKRDSCYKKVIRKLSFSRSSLINGDSMPTKLTVKNDTPIISSETPSSVSRNTTPMKKKKRREDYVHDRSRKRTKGKIPRHKVAKNKTKLKEFVDIESGIISNHDETSQVERNNMKRNCDTFVGNDKDQGVLVLESSLTTLHDQDNSHDNNKDESISFVFESSDEIYFEKLQEIKVDDVGLENISVNHESCEDHKTESPASKDENFPNETITQVDAVKIICLESYDEESISSKTKNEHLLKVVTDTEHANKCKKTVKKKKRYSQISQPVSVKKMSEESCPSLKSPDYVPKKKKYVPHMKSSISPDKIKIAIDENESLEMEKVKQNQNVGKTDLPNNNDEIPRKVDEEGVTNLHVPQFEISDKIANLDNSIDKNINNTKTQVSTVSIINNSATNENFTKFSHKSSSSYTKDICPCQKDIESDDEELGGKCSISHLVCCNCGQWFHVECVNLTKAQASQMIINKIPFTCIFCVTKMFKSIEPIKERLLNLLNSQDEPLEVKQSEEIIEDNIVTLENRDVEEKLDVPCKNEDCDDLTEKAETILSEEEHDDHNSILDKLIINLTSSSDIKPSFLNDSGVKPTVPNKEHYIWDEFY